MTEAVQKSVQRERRSFGSNRVRPNVCADFVCVLWLVLRAVVWRHCEKSVV